MRVLITGAGGQLGRELVDAFVDHDTVGCGRDVLDITDRDQVLQVVDHIHPDVIVHAAAWTDVDGCETDPDRALEVNALGTRYLAAGARMVGARICYVSTDYVFDGRATRPYSEWDRPNPVSAYGRSKLGGERELSPDDTIVRTSWVCGQHGKNFVKTVLDRAVRGLELKVVKDQHGCFTLADDLAETIRRLVVARRAGTFHVTNQGPTTWYRLACDTLIAAGLELTPVQPIATAELRPPRPAPRPMFSVLDNAALRLSGLPLLPDYHDALSRLVRTLGHTRGDPATVS
ncbi:MAG TPA: dTDP-4-dehydrorhamnose reductase [Acidimicrobiales bacterium]|nr:dTDP-4-dehydrorhamnose reductase [Acidimicrobiales bacterium]